MRFPAVIPVALAAVLSAAAPVFAQDWAPMTSKEDGFRANFPGQPKVEAITYTTEFNLKLPGRVYRASDPLGRYSTTVVDYRDVERMQSSARPRAGPPRREPEGRRLVPERLHPRGGRRDGSRRIDYLKRDGVKVTQYGLYFVEVVVGTAAAPHQRRQITHKRRLPSASGTPLHPRSHRAGGHARADPLHGDRSRG
jgi:hypothetical protein